MKTLRNIFTALGIIALAGMAIPMSAAPSMQIESAAADVASMKVSAGRLELKVVGDHPVKFNVYSITGQLVKSVNVAEGTIATIELPKGMYVVKTDAWARQVIVK